MASIIIAGEFYLFFHVCEREAFFVDSLLYVALMLNALRAELSDVQFYSLSCDAGTINVAI